MGLVHLGFPAPVRCGIEEGPHTLPLWVNEGLRGNSGNAECKDPAGSKPGSRMTSGKCSRPSFSKQAKIQYRGS